MAEALYRKYRPQVFEDVVGQEPIERTLKNAIGQDKVSHAYLFCGPRGTGKTTTARLLAKALLCESGPTPNPDGSCEDCQLIADGAHPDVYELDAASRTGVENVREEIISRVQFAPTRGRYKVYIIDEVHMLSPAAFNALLKTLEEPPSHVVFILCTTDPQKVPETIHSRCQRFEFRRIAPETMVSRLGAICMAEGVEFEGEALDLIAQRAEGGLRNALTSLEQIIAFENGKVTLTGAERLLGSIDSSDLADIMANIGQRDIANCFRWTASYVETGADLAQFVRDMSEHVRNLYVMALVGDDADVEVSETSRRQLAHELQWFGADRASRLLGVLGDLSAELKTSSNPRLSFEIALTRMVRPDSDLTLESLAERIEALESGYSAVAHVVADAAPSLRWEEPASRLSAPSEAERLRSEVPQPSLRPSARDGADGAAFVGDSGGKLAVDVASTESVAADAEEGAVQPVGQSSAGMLSNPASLQRIWQAALAEVKKQKQAHGVLFMNTKVRLDEATGALRIVFPAESAFAFNAVQKPDVQDALTASLRKAAGFDVVYRYEQAGGRTVQPAQPVAQQPARQMQQQARLQVQQQTQSQSQVQVQPQVQQQPQRQQESGSARQQAQPRVESKPAFAPEPEPYDQVPYEDLAYEPVPYDDYESPAPAPAAAEAPATPSPASDDEGVDAADIEAMLQAGFGGNVVFSEID